jgi:hypothetical protein
MQVETLGEASAAGWQVDARCRSARANDVPWVRPSADPAAPVVADGVKTGWLASVAVLAAETVAARS